ncbi:MAG TPA: hypothetical protein VG498_19020 [Terriglobales bacterium]|nr:hypothetical protein [Terriglobales bacterium]
MSRSGSADLTPVWSPETTQASMPLPAGCLVTKDVKVAVVCPELEELVFGATPLIDYFLHEILAFVQSEPNRYLVGLATRIALNVQLHE